MAKLRKPFFFTSVKKSCRNEKQRLETIIFRDSKTCIFCVDLVPKLIQKYFLTMEQKFVQRCETKVVANACLLAQFEFLSFITFWVFEFPYNFICLSFITILVFEFPQNLIFWASSKFIFWVSSQFKFIQKFYVKKNFCEKKKKLW